MPGFSTSCGEPTAPHKGDRHAGQQRRGYKYRGQELETARKFYQGTLGLTLVGTEGEELIAFGSGNSRIFVYKSQYAGTNKATAVTWVVGEDVEGVVRALKAKGVTFERYDMPDMTLKGDIHVSGDMKVAWFKDPEGNILNIVNG